MGALGFFSRGQVYSLASSGPEVSLALRAWYRVIMTVGSTRDRLLGEVSSSPGLSFCRLVCGTASCVRVATSTFDESWS
jgi:hypothetical protein